MESKLTLISTSMKMMTLYNTNKPKNEYKTEKVLCDLE